MWVWVWVQGHGHGQGHGAWGMGVDGPGRAGQDEARQGKAAKLQSCKAPARTVTHLTSRLVTEKNGAARPSVLAQPSGSPPKTNPAWPARSRIGPPTAPLQPPKDAPSFPGLGGSGGCGGCGCKEQESKRERRALDCSCSCSTCLGTTRHRYFVPINSSYSAPYVSMTLAGGHTVLLCMRAMCAYAIRNTYTFTGAHGFCGCRHRVLFNDHVCVSIHVFHGVRYIVSQDGDPPPPPFPSSLLFQAKCHETCIQPDGNKTSTVAHLGLTVLYCYTPSLLAGAEPDCGMYILGAVGFAPDGLARCDAHLLVGAVTAPNG